MPPLFEIRDLICSYTGDPSRPVLTVSHLDIPAGEIIFLLGASGSGKSTLLELLGLMSDTRVAGTILLNTSSGQYSYEELWRNGNTKQLSAVRRGTLGFIFQNTNLMNNFSVFENICLSSMIQRNLTQEQAMTAAQDTLRRVGMPPEQMSLHTPASRLSGGQRQRVAFARALNSRPLVLFGDEPAGNLDEKNADDLMQVIRTDLQDITSAIIVSHDIRLALRHADRIICLHKPDAKQSATIRDSDVFPNNKWRNMNAHEKESFAAQLREYYHVNIDKPIKDSKYEPTEALADSYQKLFLRNEGRSLLGPSYSNLILLVGIFLITLLAIGFANGSLEYLSIKLKNPFVNWLTVDIPYSRKEDLGKILEHLQSLEAKAKHHIGSVNLYKETSMYLFPWQNELLTASPKNINLSNIRYCWARTVSTDGSGDPLMNEVLHPDNILQGKPTTFGKFDFGLIVTGAFLDSLGYPLNTPVIYYKHRNDVLPFTIKCVVKEMPGQSQIIMTEYFMKSIRQNGNGPLDLSNKSRFLLLLRNNDAQSSDIVEKCREFFNQDKRWTMFEPEVSDAEQMQDVQGGDFKQIMVRFNSVEASGNLGVMLDSAATELVKYLGNMEKGFIYRLHDYSDYGQSPSNEFLAYDRISINFKDLEKVRDFAAWFFTEFNEPYHHEEGAVFQADISKVREKENFYFLSTVAYIISFLVLVFGILAITLFVTSMLITHLSKITMNIGTFKAFGLSDRDAQSIYFYIVLRFILISLVTSVLVALGVGLILELILSRSMLVNEKIHFFLLFDPRTLMAITLVLFFGVIASWRTIRRMLNKTPGDLIYSR